MTNVVAGEKRVIVYRHLEEYNQIVDILTLKIYLGRTIL